MRLPAIAAIAALVAACNIFAPTTTIDGELYASNSSTDTVLIRATAPGSAGDKTVWSIPPGADGFVAALVGAKIEVVNSHTCAVLATLDPIRARVTAVIKNDGSAMFQGLAPGSSTTQQPAFQTVPDCGVPAS